MYDAQGFDKVQGGHPHVLPLMLQGLKIEAPRLTNSSQVTGSGSTALRAYVDAGVLFYEEGQVKEFNGQEVAVKTANNYLTLDQAVWYVGVYVKKPYNVWLLQWIPGEIVTGTDDATIPDLETIKAAVGDYDFYVLGAIRYHRSADTKITTATSDSPRAFYSYEGEKTLLTDDPASPSTLGYRFRGYVCFNAELGQMSGVGAGNPYMTGLPMHDFPLGGFLGAVWGFQTAKNGASGSAVVVRLTIDGTDVTGNDLTMAAASTAVPAVLKASGSFTNNTHRFLRGAVLGLKYVSESAAFTAGAGRFFVPVYEYVR